MTRRWPDRPEGPDFGPAANPAKAGAMYRNIFLVGGWTVASRLTGFLRDMALAALMGGGALNDAYVAAIKLPNQFRQIFGEGSFNAAYLPTYTRVLKAGGRGGSRTNSRARFSRCSSCRRLLCSASSISTCRSSYA